MQKTEDAVAFLTDGAVQSTSERTLPCAPNVHVSLCHQMTFLSLKCLLADLMYKSFRLRFFHLSFFYPFYATLYCLNRFIVLNSFEVLFLYTVDI